MQALTLYIDASTSPAPTRHHHSCFIRSCFKNDTSFLTPLIFEYFKKLALNHIKITYSLIIDFLCSPKILMNTTRNFNAFNSNANANASRGRGGANRGGPHRGGSYRGANRGGRGGRGGNRGGYNARPRFQTISLFTEPHAYIQIYRGCDYKQIFNDLYSLATLYGNVDPEYMNQPLKNDTFSKPLTQLPNITPQMNIISDDLYNSYIDALQFVDRITNGISKCTRGNDASNYVNVKLLNPYEIRYHVDVFGVTQPDDNKYCQMICAPSVLRFTAMKAERMIFMYYYILSHSTTSFGSIDNTTYDINKYIFGAINYAVFVHDSLLQRHKPESMADLAYLWTLDTFFNGLHAINHENIVTQGVDVLPSHHTFPYLHRLNNIDNLSNVNSYVVNNGIDVETLLNNESDSFEKHLYTYPKCETYISLDADIKFYNPSNIAKDYHSTKAFVETIQSITQIQNNEGYKTIQIFDALDHLNAFEREFIQNRANVSENNEVMLKFESFSDAVNYCKSIQIPEEFDVNNIAFMCLIRNQQTTQSTPYGLVTIQISNGEAQEKLIEQAQQQLKYEAAQPEATQTEDDYYDF